MGLLLKCEHVDFGYENQDAVIDVSLEVSTGDYICIVGENGSGKSTLMKGILGLLKPTEGKIEISEAAFLKVRDPQPLQIGKSCLLLFWGVERTVSSFSKAAGNNHLKYGGRKILLRRRLLRQITNTGFLKLFRYFNLSLRRF